MTQAIQFGTLSLEPVAVWGRPDTGAFSLVIPKMLARDLDVQRLYAQRGWQLIGHIAVVDGAPRVSLEVELSDSAIKKITRAYLDVLERATSAVAEHFQDPRLNC